MKTDSTIPPDSVRIPSVAGAFYPADRDTLARDVDEMLEAASIDHNLPNVGALVSPHAGYRYSGQTAASAIKYIVGRTYQTVIVICPNHRDVFSGVSVYGGTAYETPIGRIALDVDVIEHLCRLCPSVHRSNDGHREEHAIEVILPFLQRALTQGWTLVPLVMNDYDGNTCRKLADAILEAAGESTLVVASSDLYHGYSYSQCHETDAQTLGAVSRFDPAELLKGLQTGEYQACGGGPIAVAMAVAGARGATGATIIDHTTSGDVTGVHDGYVVGYGAAIISNGRESAASQDEPLTESDQAVLLKVARDAVLGAVLRPGEAPSAPVKEPMSPGLLRTSGAFVTIFIRGELHGCIGRTETRQPLYETVHEVAQAAATGDPRFPPLTGTELEDLSVSISVLGPMMPLPSPDALEIGKHGLFIRQGLAAGLLLPQVATERNWDRTDYLENTCLKAGLPDDAWRNPETEILHFSAEVFGDHPS